MKKAIFFSLFILSLLFNISYSHAYTISKRGAIGGGAFTPVYKKNVAKVEVKSGVNYQEEIAKQIFERTYSAQKAAKKINLDEEIKQVEINRNRPLEVQIKEFSGLQWNFDCDKNIVEYYDEDKIGEKLKLFFNAKEKGMTRIYFDLVADENTSEVLETRYLDLFIDKDMQNEESQDSTIY